MAGATIAEPATPPPVAPAAGLTLAGKDIDALSGGSLKPPLVSIVVVGRNHARFAGETIDSIRRQDYTAFECFIVDNGSTDGMPDVIRRHVGDDPRFTTVFRPDNVGQLGGLMEVFDRLSGEFVICVDTDDVLLDNALSTHLQVHVALPSLVGVTTCAIIQTGEDGRVIFSGAGESPFAKNGGRLVDPAMALRLPTISDDRYRLLNGAVISIRHDQGRWLWSPGTANMYRRSAMALIRPRRPVTGAHLYVDAFFGPLCHTLMGTAMIMLPLSSYRIHTTNVSSITIYAPWLYTSRRAPLQQNLRIAERLAALLQDPAGLAHMVGSYRFWRCIEQVRIIEHRAREEEIWAPFAEKYGALVATFGVGATLRNLSLLFPRSVVRRIVARGTGRPPRPKEDATIAMSEALWQSRRIARGIVVRLRGFRSHIISR